MIRGLSGGGWMMFALIASMRARDDEGNRTP
jgi:hypothetical protein